ncbi:5578_t:CDS:1 [Acaulospora morrowiae]|uniref:5578_t:CDS:1 n=1 Tax=Acaulospora morrowiae TaxID=94023 RepID=A0A9N8ZN42_9GLOM|nr:5578_t:CDS:1 [Acaulospora morrowiae]
MASTVSFATFNTLSDTDETVRKDFNRVCADVNEYLEYLADILEDEVEEESDDEVAPSVQRFLAEYQEYLTTNKSNSILCSKKDDIESDEESDCGASTISFASSSKYTDTTFVESPLSTSPNEKYCFSAAYAGSTFSSQDPSKTMARRSSVASRMKRKNRFHPNLWKYSSISTCSSLDMTPKALSPTNLSAPSKASISVVDESNNVFATFASSDSSEHDSSDSINSSETIKLLRSQLNEMREKGIVIKKEDANSSRDIAPLARLMAVWSVNIPFLSIFIPKEGTSTVTTVTAGDDKDDNNDKKSDDVGKSEMTSTPTEVVKVDGNNKVPPKNDQFKLVELFVNIMKNAKVKV